jgi:hypothetical protein
MLSRLVRGVEGNGAWAERSAISVACREGQPRRNALVFTEVAGEAGFDDLVALTQVRLPKRAKLGLARNYWDEMGRGNAKGMHGPMLETLSTAMALRPKAEETVWESLALANTMAGLAANRCYACHAVGALGAIDLTAPGFRSLV